jgi:transposase
MEARILEKTRQASPDRSTHWSTRKLGRLLHIHHNLVGKAWRRAGLQPHRFERYMQSDDPDFETNFRHGTLSLLAALNTKSGEVRGQTVPRHTSAAFVDFLGAIVTNQPKGREIHVIADTLSTHKTQAVRTFLLAHPTVHLHFTPTYSSWLNQVELWFAKIAETCSRAVSSHRSRTLGGRFATTTRRRNQSAGVIATRRIELVVLQ